MGRGSGELLETVGQGGFRKCPLYGLAALLYLSKDSALGLGPPLGTAGRSQAKG